MAPSRGTCLPMGSGLVMVVEKNPSFSTRPYRPAHWLCRLLGAGRQSQGHFQHVFQRQSGLCISPGVGEAPGDQGVLLLVCRVALRLLALHTGADTPEANQVNLDEQERLWHA